MKNVFNYDYDKTISDPISIGIDNEIERLLKNRDIDYVYATKTIKSSEQFEIEIYPEFSRSTADRLNIKKKSKKAQRNLNEKNSRKQLERLINCNFKENDLWVTFTYSNKYLPKSIKEANNNMKNYIRRINYRRKKIGLDNAKYIFITEYDEENKKRIHHHLIIENGLSMNEIEETWHFGKRNNVRKVDPDDEDGLTGLAKYLAKDPKGKKRWYGSKNLSKPKVRKSYTVFPYSKIRKMIANDLSIAELMQRQYKNKKYIEHEIMYNKVNNMFYIHVRMVERKDE